MLLLSSNSLEIHQNLRPALEGKQDKLILNLEKQTRTWKLHIFSGYENQTNMARKWSRVVGERTREKPELRTHTCAQQHGALGSASTRHKSWNNSNSEPSGSNSVPHLKPSKEKFLRTTGDLLPSTVVSNRSSTESPGSNNDLLMRRPSWTKLAKTKTRRLLYFHQDIHIVKASYHDHIPRFHSVFHRKSESPLAGRERPGQEIPLVYFDK
mgnify:FL=1